MYSLSDGDTHFWNNGSRASTANPDGKYSMSSVSE